MSKWDGDSWRRFVENEPCGGDRFWNVQVSHFIFLLLMALAK